MKAILTLIALAGVLLATGCVTTSQSKSEYQAQIAGLEAQNAAFQSRLAAIEEVRRAMEAYEMTKFREWQRSEGRRPHRPGGS